MDTSPLIHIGYHKTGTTWLQNGLFQDEEAGFGKVDNRVSLLQEVLVLINALDFDVDHARGVVGPHVEAIAERGLHPVISAERLSGNPHSGGYDSKDIADRVAAVFPEARVLIVIREQRGIVLSSYKQYVRVGGVLPISAYLDPPRRERGRIPMFSFDHFRYHRLIGHYQRLFGEERVLVLPYELLRQDPLRFSTEILAFAGLDPLGVEQPRQRRDNAASSGAGVAVERQVNRLLGRQTPLNPGVPAGIPRRLYKGVLGASGRVAAALPDAVSKRADQQMREEVARRVGDRYRESNRQTEALTGLDLASYSYAL